MTTHTKHWLRLLIPTNIPKPATVLLDKYATDILSAEKLIYPENKT